MADLRQFSLKDMSELGAALRQLGNGARSMETVARRVVQHLRDNLVDQRTGASACALVRLFKTHACGDLDPELQAFASGFLAGQAVPPEMKCLTLIATEGDRPAWCDRRQSVRHQAVPLPSAKAVEAYLPMLADLIRQLGLTTEQVLRPEATNLLEAEQRTYNVFYVPVASGSPYLYAQNEFVIPFGIQSALGFGAMLPSGNLFVVILFSKVPVPQRTASLFAPVALSVKLALLPFDDTVFATAGGDE